MSADGSEVRPQLGVGLIYVKELEGLLDGSHDNIAVVELEPQTLWEKVLLEGRWSYVPNQELLDRVAALPLATLMHGIGQPFGGSVPDPVEHLSLLRETADRIRPVWASEHLSFNRVALGGSAHEAGFLLPPPQNAAAVRVAARNIRRYGESLGLPVAFETGVNYLRPSAPQMGDAEYWSDVAETADCGILLDLHNLWCNEVNGRATVREVLDGLPLERVWEVHLAGGMPMSGYWLDAHSGRVPPPLLELAAEAIPRLPNLGALLFELLPEHFDSVGLDGVRDQIDELCQLWALRSPRRLEAGVNRSRVDLGEPSEADLAEVRLWEETLYRTITGTPGPPTAAASLAEDPGVVVYRELVLDFRRGNLVQTMRHTLTLLLLELGRQGTEELLAGYFGQSPAESYRAVEAYNFASFLRTRSGLHGIRYLPEVLAFEDALVRATVLGERTRVDWTADPTAILAALQRGELPPLLPSTPSSMLISA